MTIRPMTRDDVPACVDLFIDVLGKPPWNEQWTLPLAAERVGWALELPSGFGLVALDDDEAVLGLLTGYYDTWITGRQFHIYEFEVRTDQQNQGIGSSMLSVLEQHIAAQNTTAICLLTERGYPAAEFYKHRGFRVHDQLVFMSKSMAAAPSRPAAR